MGNSSSKSQIALVAGGAALLAFTFLIGNESPQQDEVSPTLKRGVSGLTNLGNTCFLNALLQAFSSSDTFYQFISQTIVSTPKTLDERILDQLRQCLETIRIGNGTHNPSHFLSVLWEKFSTMGEQHDSHEVFNVLQDTLQNVEPSLSYSQMLGQIQTGNPFLGLVAHEKTCLEWKNSTRNIEVISALTLDIAPSVYQSLFQYGIEETVPSVECLACSVKSEKQNLENEREELNKSQQLALLKESQLHGIKKKIDQLETWEKWNQIPDDLNIFRERKSVTLKYTIERFPKILCIHYKRLIYIGTTLLKKDGYIKFDEALKLPRPSSEFWVTYNLIAVIVHLGSAYSGHYIAYKKVDDSWFYCSDSISREAKLDEVLNCKAYMLFYEMK